MMECPNLIITKASKRREDIDRLFSIINSCAKHLNSKRQHYWDGVYTKRVISNIVKNNETRIVYEKNSPIATFTLSKRPLFGSIRYWKKVKTRKALYLSAFAVVPEKQGKGIGKHLFKMIEKIAKNNGYMFLRLNAALPLREFYLNKDFEVMDSLIHGNEKFFLLEKSLI